MFDYNSSAARLIIWREQLQPQIFDTETPNIVITLYTQQA